MRLSWLLSRYRICRQQTEEAVFYGRCRIRKSQRGHKYNVEELLARDKTSLDITWIRQSNDVEDITLSELMADSKGKSDNIASAVSKLQELFAQLNIKED